MDDFLKIWGILIGLWVVWQICRAIVRGFVAAYQTASELASERQARLDEIEAKQGAERETRAQRRRDDARAQVEMFFQLHEIKLAQRLSRDLFKDLLQRMMGSDDLPPELVEARGRELRRLIEGHLREIDPPKPTAEAERADARLLVRRFYDRHRNVLVDYPEEMVESYLSRHLSDRTPVEQCWEAALRFIEQLRGEVAQGRQRARSEEDRTRSLEMRREEISRQIRDLEEEVRQLRESPLDPEIIENEILNLHRRIRKLQQDRDLLR